MAAELLFAPEVEWDVLEDYACYEGRRSGLGEDFMTCVDACVQAICRHPEMYAVVYEDYRRALVRRFPYSVFYEYSQNAVTVYCVTTLVTPRNGVNAWTHGRYSRLRFAER